MAVIVWACSYWGSLLIGGALTFFILPSSVFWVGYAIVFFCILCGAIASLALSGLGCKGWFKTIFMGGVRKLSRELTKLSKEVGENEQ